MGSDNSFGSQVLRSEYMGNFRVTPNHHGIYEAKTNDKGVQRFGDMLELLSRETKLNISRVTKSSELTFAIALRC